VKATDILSLCQDILTQNKEPSALSKDEIRTLAYLAEWKVASLQALWKGKDEYYFERMEMT